MTNTESWLLARQALDQNETTQAIRAALPKTIMDGFQEVHLDEIVADNLASDLAIELACAGIALVRLDPIPFTARKED